MQLSSGTRFGPYEITGPLGAGGMGEVYRARDSKLNRDVAIKILPESVGTDPERLLRFEREARTLASLNHPNIAQVYGSLDQPPALVMELVEGEDLAVRLARGALAIDDALDMAAQIAAALEEAHERGIIHRDLKPGNVMIRADGTIKVLDFGLAKAFEPQSGPVDLLNSPTMTGPTTQMGIILGTAAYMAPEQAKGRAVDKRADIWAFGIVLYEMLTGHRPFSAGTVTETLAAVLRADIDLDALPGGVPARVRWLLARCLERDPRNRLRDIGEARVLLARSDAPDSVAPTRRGAFWLVLTAVLAGAAATSLVWFAAGRGSSGEVSPAIRFTLAPPAGTRYVLTSPAALSVDGTRLVFAAVSLTAPDVRLYQRTLDRPESAPIAGTDGASGPFLSPDSQWIGFFTGEKLRKVPVTGGEAMPIVDAPEPRGGAWRTDGSIIFAREATGGLSKVSAEGGAAEPFTVVDPARNEISHRYPHVLPDGRVVFSILTTDPVGPAIGFAEAQGGAHRTLVERAFSPQYIDTGHLLFARAVPVVANPPDAPVEVSVVAAALRGDRLSTQSVPIIGNVAAIQLLSGAHFVASRNGTIATIGLPPTPRRLLWIDRSGTEQPISLPSRDYANARISPDGRSVVLVSGDGEGGLWLLDLQRQLLEPVAEGLKRPAGPVWAPDGRSVIVGGLHGGGAGVLRVGLERTSVPQPVIARPLLATPSDAHGKTLIVEVLSMATRIDLATLELGRDEAPRPLLQSPAVEATGRLSPDGRLLAYRQDSDVYVRVFPEAGRAIRLSRSNGRNPVWSRDGRTLFFQSAGALMAAAIRSEEPEGEPRVILSSVEGALQGVSSDGTRFLFLRSEETPQLPMTITVGGLRQLLGRAGGRR